MLDDEPIGFDSISAYTDADLLRSEPLLRQPYGMARLENGGFVTTWMQRERDDPSRWWLHYNTQAPAPAPVRQDAIVRYRLDGDAGDPVVHVGILCERPEDECARLREFVMKGLPFAKPRR